MKTQGNNNGGQAPLCAVIQRIIVCSVVLLSACVLQPEKPAPAPEKPAPVQTVQKPVTPPPPPPPKPVVVKDESPVAVILSADTAVFTRISDQLQKQLGKRAVIYRLKGNISRLGDIREQVQKSKAKKVVAIGLLAAQTASYLKDKHIIFSKVFNYQDSRLLGNSMKGVSMTPSPDNVFSTWKQITPHPKKIVIITGSGMQSLIERIRQAASKNGFEITHREVKNDKEFIFASKALLKDAGGMWLLPDNRVLSRSALRELMALSIKEGRQIISNQPGLLRYGALASFECNDVSTARRINSLLKKPFDKIPSLSNVDTNQVLISQQTLERLSLSVPEKLKKHITEQ